MRVLRVFVLVLVAVAVVVAAGLVYAARDTRAVIDAFERRVLARTAPAPAADPAGWVDLPEPVRRYFAFAFPQGTPRQAGIAWIEVEAAGQFRRPRTETFAPTTARQVVSVTTPDLVFSADTPVLGPLWAIAYDAYLDGRMEMRAKLLSAVTVMAERSTPDLNRTSLRRWLLESPLYPMALLPGGPVRWEPVDERRARAVVSAHGETASLVATFAADGALERFDAEADGDLTTPYHGSGEHATRSDYRLVDGVRIPMAFEIARAAEGRIYPFWTGRITAIRFGP